MMIYNDTITTRRDGTGSVTLKAHPGGATLGLNGPDGLKVAAILSRADLARLKKKIEEIEVRLGPMP